MLDSFIIDRIRRERDRDQERGHQPLRIERRPPPPPGTDDDRAPERGPPPGPDRGTAVIDYQL